MQVNLVSYGNTSVRTSVTECPCSTLIRSDSFLATHDNLSYLVLFFFCFLFFVFFYPENFLWAFIVAFLQAQKGLEILPIFNTHTTFSEAKD